MIDSSADSCVSSETVVTEFVIFFFIAQMYWKYIMEKMEYCSK
jgi:hypothetical protein